MVERLRRDKPEVVEVVRLLPACECGATLLEPVSAWWGGRLVRLHCGAAPGRASGTRRRRRRQRWQHEHDRAIVTSEAPAAPNPCDVCDAARRLLRGDQWDAGCAGGTLNVRAVSGWVGSSKREEESTSSTLSCCGRCHTNAHRCRHAPGRFRPIVRQGLRRPHLSGAPRMLGTWACLLLFRLCHGGTRKHTKCISPSIGWIAG